MTDITEVSEKRSRRQGERGLKGREVDVVLLTKNSARLLKDCLASVYQNVPIHNLIVVDGYSTDATLDILNEFHGKYGNVVVIQDEGTRGAARQRAIREVTTDWFMFVDSDVVLCEGWFAKAARLMKDNVGAIWGVEIWSVVSRMKILRLFEQVTMKIFERRGGTHDLLVRRKAVEGIRIPCHLHTYEDSYIKSWICQKGYRAVPVYEPYCVHYRPESVWTIRQSIDFIVSDLKFAIKYPQLMLSYVVYAAIVLYQNFQRNFGPRRLK